MTQVLAEYMLLLLVVAGLITATLLGLALGLYGVGVATKTAIRQAKVIRRQRRELARVQREGALAVSQREDALRQLGLANAALEERTHAVQHSADLPALVHDPGTDALMADLVGDVGPFDDVEPHGAHHRPDEGDTWAHGEQV